MENAKQLLQSSLDIKAAREKATFSIDGLATLIRGGPEAVQRRQRLRALLENDPIFDLGRAPFQSRQEQMADSIHTARRLIEIAEEQHMTFKDFGEFLYNTGYSSPLTLNYAAFMPVIESQGDDAQVAKWLTAAKRHAIIGCYAQTELSHGSNVVGLQTTATFDETTDEFIINSPDITAAKWWIGSLGIAATHAVVQAQLIIKGKNYGPHLFITPIRSPVDFKPVKGVTVGDIGPKAYGGFSTTDNGYAFFDHVRIPRNYMLMRFAKVSPTGEYTAPVHAKLSYGSMVNLRVGIVSDAGWRLAKATTVAVRYCTARRQFNPSGPDNLESQVISYSSVKHRLMPLLASSYALIVGSQGLSAAFRLMTKQLSQQDPRMLPEMHVTSCALKVWAARRGSEGIEECRKTMGGHGYSVFSGISEGFANFVPANTYEGDNFVLCQQVGRALLKELGNLAAEKPIRLRTAEYLAFLRKDTTSTIGLDTAGAVLDPTVQLKILGTRAARLVAVLGRKVQAGRDWNDVNMDSWEICFAHAEYHLLHQLINKSREIQSSQKHAHLAPVFKSLADLFFLALASTSALATLLITRTIDPTDAELIQEQYQNALDKFAVDAIGLTDAFDFTDTELNTALGKKDGNPYGALWDAVQKNPLNSADGREQFGNLMKTILHRKDNLAYIKAAKL